MSGFVFFPMGGGGFGFPGGTPGTVRVTTPDQRALDVTMNVLVHRNACAASWNGNQDVNFLVANALRINGVDVSSAGFPSRVPGPDRADGAHAEVTRVAARKTALANGKTLSPPAPKPVVEEAPREEWEAGDAFERAMREVEAEGDSDKPRDFLDYGSSAWRRRQFP